MHQLLRSACQVQLCNIAVQLLATLHLCCPCQQSHHQQQQQLTTSNSVGMPLANSTEANTAAPSDTVPVSCSVTLFTKLQQEAAAQTAAGSKQRCPGQHSHRIAPNVGCQTSRRATICGYQQSIATEQAGLCKGNTAAAQPPWPGAALTCSREHCAKQNTHCRTTTIAVQAASAAHL